ncbi:cofilin [Linderina macrospora]|uniref:Cofilin n=1 Tax=Linderina macrospora TaxID=4868 RepID=A0ACC1J1S6_9FUNG|nr:cofilin [Linderina macrospora]
MSSGVAVNDSCLDAFTGLKLKHTAKYVVYKLNDSNDEIVVDKTSEATDYDAFIADLPETECRWAVYDLEYNKGEGVRNKILFIAWSPDNAKIKNKMLYASSKDALRKKLVGIAAEVQATDFDEVAYESVLDKAMRGTR